ncbi:conserved hypothetical protein [uncultured Eubacteriales bacterium]|uniref:Nucleoside 2-deoxyribosyltransferase n=1 Tax=uncultured Eubacteriales bacterium TaxID=172733 RepID=A0A212JA42_9FIRM|nr:conserved hypothetical protein [uncultured Eubacteriales bacterium]
MAKKIYTAGFDIFHPRRKEHMEEIHRLCEAYGLEPHFQLEAPAGGKPAAGEILRMNLERIDACDLVSANLNPFRGLEMDSGTAFEVGYAHARGKLIYGYMDDVRPMVEKLGGERDAEGYTVENFGLPLNLMIACTAKVVQGTLEDCLKAICKDETTTA